MPNYGVIDLGSNSVRLCVYEVKNDSKRSYAKKDFRTLLNNKVMAGLSAHIENGVFTERGIRHAISVLNGHNKRLKYFNCKRIDTFATAVLRNAINSEEAIRHIEKASGLSITVLSEQDEAHLGFIGASSDQHLENGTLVDIGGGSTELSRIRKGQDLGSASIAMGSLSSYTKYVRAVLPTQNEKDEICRAFNKKYDHLAKPSRYESERLFGIGGSIRAAVKVYSELLSLEKRPEILRHEDFDELINFGLKKPHEFAHICLKAAPDRIHTVLPGCFIVQSIMEKCNAPELILCKNGVREGYLIERVLLERTKNKLSGEYALP